MVVFKELAVDLRGLSISRKLDLNFKASRMVSQIGMTALTAKFKTTYSLCAVDRQISEISCDFHTMGTPPNLMMYPIQDHAESGSTQLSAPYIPARLASQWMDML